MDVIFEVLGALIMGMMTQAITIDKSNMNIVSNLQDSTRGTSNLLAGFFYKAQAFCNEVSRINAKKFVKLRVDSLL